MFKGYYGSTKKGICSRMDVREDIFWKVMARFNLERWAKIRKEKRCKGKDESFWGDSKSKGREVRNQKSMLFIIHNSVFLHSKMWRRGQHGMKLQRGLVVRSREVSVIWPLIYYHIRQHEWKYLKMGKKTPT